MCTFSNARDCPNIKDIKLTAVFLALSDIFLPIINCIGIMIAMHKIGAIRVLAPSNRYNKYMIKPI